MNDDQLVEAYTGGGAGLPGLRAVELAATTDLTAQLQAARATIAEAITEGELVQEQLQQGDSLNSVIDILSRANPSTTPKETR